MKTNNGVQLELNDTVQTSVTYVPNANYIKNRIIDSSGNLIGNDSFKFEAVDEDELESNFSYYKLEPVDDSSAELSFLSTQYDFYEIGDTITLNTVEDNDDIFSSQIGWYNTLDLKCSLKENV